MCFSTCFIAFSFIQFHLYISCLINRLFNNWYQSYWFELRKLGSPRRETLHKKRWERDDAWKLGALEDAAWYQCCVKIGSPRSRCMVSKEGCFIYTKHFLNFSFEYSSKYFIWCGRLKQNKCPDGGCSISALYPEACHVCKGIVFLPKQHHLRWLKLKHLNLSLLLPVCMILSYGSRSIFRLDSDLGKGHWTRWGSREAHLQSRPSKIEGNMVHSCHFLFNPLVQQGAVTEGKEIVVFFWKTLYIEVVHAGGRETMLERILQRWNRVVAGERCRHLQLSAPCPYVQITKNAHKARIWSQEEKLRRKPSIRILGIYSKKTQNFFEGLFSCLKF